MAQLLFRRTLNHPDTLHYGIIGYPLAHSFSPAYFRKKFADLHLSATYEAYPISAITELPTLLEEHTNIEGLNVTLPYKESVIAYLHEVDEVAAAIGAVNCVSIKNGHRKGYNTDAEGFEDSLVPLLTSRHSQALILGTGGSSKAIAYVLSQMGMPFRKVSSRRSQHDLTYEDLTLDLIDAYKLIINTTPLGMYPDLDNSPMLPYKGIGEHHLLYDLIYNPEETQFLQRGRERGATIKNGFEMLQLQAEASWDIWTKSTMPE